MGNMLSSIFDSDGNAIDFIDAIPMILEGTLVVVILAFGVFFIIQGKELYNAL